MPPVKGVWVTFTTRSDAPGVSGEGRSRPAAAMPGRSFASNSPRSIGASTRGRDSVTGPI